MNNDIFDTVEEVLINEKPKALLKGTKPYHMIVLILRRDDFISSFIIQQHAIARLPIS